MVSAVAVVAAVGGNPLGPREAGAAATETEAVRAEAATEEVEVGVAMAILGNRVVAAVVAEETAAEAEATEVEATTATLHDVGGGSVVSTTPTRTHHRPGKGRETR